MCIRQGEELRAGCRVRSCVLPTMPSLNITVFIET